MPAGFVLNPEREQYLGPIAKMPPGQTWTLAVDFVSPASRLTSEQCREESRRSMQAEETQSSVAP